MEVTDLIDLFCLLKKNKNNKVIDRAVKFISVIFPQFETVKNPERKSDRSISKHYKSQTERDLHSFLSCGGHP